MGKHEKVVYNDMEWDIVYGDESRDPKWAKQLKQMSDHIVRGGLPFYISKPECPKMVLTAHSKGALGPIFDIAPKEEEIEVRFEKSVKDLTIQPDNSFYFLYTKNFQQYEIDVHLKPKRKDGA
jgi:hypothetical protein